MTLLIGYRRAVFVDTSAFFAAADHSDSGHAAAIKFFQTLLSERIVPYTTNFVLAECHALLVNRLGVRAGLTFLALIERRDVELERVTIEEELRARDILHQYRDKSFSYTDATSFATMERLGLREAFSFDSDFSQYGFRTLPDT